MITSAQKISTSKYLYNCYWLRARSGGVDRMTVTSNIGIYCPCIFCVRPGPNQYYFPEYIMGASFIIFHEEGEGKNNRVKVIKRSQKIILD